MTLRYYPAVIEEGDGTFGVFFPDLDGCTSAGDTVAEAATNAAEALGGHLRLMVRDGDPLPEPGGIDQWPADPEVIEACRVLVPVNVDIPGRAVRVAVTIEENLLARIDSAAKAEGATRSGFLAIAARERLET